jgi:uroporphyrinogen-III synthase
LLTSANAARHGGAGLAPLLGLPCYTVGEATAEAAREAGFREVRTGPGDGAAVLATMAGDGVGRALHLCGRDHLPLEDPAVVLERRTVYAAEEVKALGHDAAEAVRAGALALIHSGRAGATFAALVEQAGLGRANTSIVAISEAAAAAAGAGWRAVHAASRPRDDALLELAAKLCKTGGGDTGNGA